MKRRQITTARRGRSRPMGRAQTAVLAVLISFGLWCATRAEAMPEQAKIIIEDNSGPWLVLAAAVSVAGGIFFARRGKS